MLYCIRESTLVRIFMGFMAVYLFNISADAPDAKGAYVSEDLSINDMESVAELFLEGVFKLDNVVPEQDDPDRDDDDALKFQKLTVDMPRQADDLFCHAIDAGTKVCLPTQSGCFQGITPENTSPPPRSW